ncbi:MAG: hypothetical protein ABIK32_04620 [Chloroflexota bacterium]
MKLKPKTTLLPDETKELDLVTLHESLFWDRDDPRRAWLNGKATSGGDYAQRHEEGGHDIDMQTDSYIWCFTGPRGSGKTTLMTMYAIKCHWLYNTRLISNYPIECKLQRLHGAPEVVKAEPLDLYKLLCFEDDYSDCLILIDEAADIVSHLASMSWKNRLLNIFIRQLRKNHNSLFLGSQEFGLIDKSMRWQTDILCECTDASRKYGWPPSERGKVILARLYDNSGMWTGESLEEKTNRLRHSRHYEHLSACQMQIFPRVLWGEKGETKSVYDTYFVQDIWESLRKVDMRMSTYDVGDRAKEVVPSTLAWVGKAAPVIGEYMRLQSEEPGRAGFYTKAFYSSVGALNTKEKDALSKRLNDCNAKVGCDGSGKRYYDFSEFDLNKFSGT